MKNNAKTPSKQEQEQFVKSKDPYCNIYILIQHKEWLYF